MTPGTRETASPSNGERCWAPWISWMRSARPVVVKEKVKSPVIVSGGSSPSLSETAAPRTVTVQRSPAARSRAGSSVNVRGPPVTVTATALLRVQLSEKPPSATVTSSENVTSMFVVVGTSEAPSSGFVSVTVGAASPGGAVQGRRRLEVVSGAGVPAVKSGVFWSVSWQPPAARESDVVFERPGAGAPSESDAVP